MVCPRTITTFALEKKNIRFISGLTYKGSKDYDYFELRSDFTCCKSNLTDEEIRGKKKCLREQGASPQAIAGRFFMSVYLTARPRHTTEQQ